MAIKSSSVSGIRKVSRLLGTWLVEMRQVFNNVGRRWHGADLGCYAAGVRSIAIVGEKHVDGLHNPRGIGLLGGQCQGSATSDSAFRVTELIGRLWEA
jgi:hypothetical protein